MPLAAWVFTLVTFSLWSCTPALVVAAGLVPPSLLVAVSFLVAGLMLGSRRAAWRTSWRMLAMGGLCFAAYRLVVVAAFAHAKPVEVNLMTSFQPVLVVLLPPLMLTGYRFSWIHFAAAACGLAGEWIGLLAGGLSTLHGEAAGLLFALFSAFFWAVYSVQLKRLQTVPSESVGAFLVIAGLVCAVGCGIDGGWRAMPGLSAHQWLMLILFGIGPTGIAYLTWDLAMKRGDPRVVGGVMFLCPLSTSVLLALINHQPMSLNQGLGAVLIVAGALICAGQRRQAPMPAVAALATKPEVAAAAEEGAGSAGTIASPPLPRPERHLAGEVDRARPRARVVPAGS